MTRWLVNGSLRSRGLVVALGIGLLFFGFVQQRDMPRDALPEFMPPTVEVQTEALGLSAIEIEQLVTVPLEQDLLNGVAYLESIKSESVPGLSRIEMIFEPGTPLSRARQVVNERLTQAFALPSVSSPPQMLQPMSSTSRVMMVRISSKQKSALELGLLARWTIRPQLMGIDGVSNVSIWGHREQQLQVHIDPARLQAEGVTLEEVIHTTGNALWVSPLTFLPSSTPGAGGFFDTSTQRIGVEHAQPITSPEALENVVIESELAPATPAGAAADRKRLGDVADVVEDHQPLIGDAVFTDGEGGLLVVVEKLPGANAVAVTERLESALKSMEPGLEGVSVDSSLLRPADYVEDSIGGLGRSVVIGLVLALLLLALLLFRLRDTLVTVASVAVTLAGAVTVLSLRGESLNVMTLAGLVLALSVLVDDAVTSAYATARSLDGVEDDRPSAFRRYAAGVVASRRPLAYATAILLVALAPMLVLTGESDAFIPPTVLSYAAAVVVSMLVAMTVAPALTMLVRSGAPRAERRSPVAASLQDQHDRLAARLGGAGIVPAFALIAAVAVVGLVGLVVIDRGRSVVPTFKDHELLIRLEGAEGTSLPEMKRISSRVGTELEGLREVEHVGGHVGRAVLGDKTVNVNSSELWLRIDDAADYGAARRKIDEILQGYPGVDAEILTYGRARIDSILGKTDGVEGKDLTVRMFGLTYEEIGRQATKVEEAVRKVNGVNDANVRLPALQPTIEIEVDLAKAQALGIKPGDVRRAATTTVSGLTVGNLFQDQKVFDVVVIGAPAVRDSITQVGEMLINPPGGQPPVRLDSVANVKVVQSPAVIRHEAVARSVDIGVDVGDRAVPEVASDIKKALLGLQHPTEYHAELLPGYEQQRRSSLRFLAVAVVALVGIFLLLQAAAGTWRMASVLFLMVVAALGGGVAGAAVRGGSWSVGFIVGLLAVLALTVRHAIAFVQRCHDLEDEGLVAEADVPSLVAGERFVPTVGSALMTIVLMVPVLVFGSRAGHEIAAPIAAVVLGGVVASVLLSAVALPLLYARFGRRSVESRERIELFTDPTPADDWQMADF